jgi:hypothetical protein
VDNEIKSGKEILDDFFEKMGEIEGVDPQVAAAIKQLYDDGKLTHTNLSNALAALREKGGAGND